MANSSVTNKNGFPEKPKGFFKSLSASLKEFCIFCETDPIPILFVLSILGCLLIIFHYYGASAELLTGLMWAFSCMAIGTLLGLIFGIPKTPVKSKATDNDTHHEPDDKTQQFLSVNAINTNLVEISDWLTKIIVGVGLVEFRQIGLTLHNLAAELGSELGAENHQVHTMFSEALIIYFLVIGFLLGYLYIRLKLGSELSEADQRTMSVFSNKMTNLEKSSDIVNTRVGVLEETINKNSKILEKIGTVRVLLEEFKFVLERNVRDPNLDNLLARAKIEVENALTVDQYNVECLKLKARIHESKARWAMKIGNDTEANDNWNKAIGILNTAISNNDRSKLYQIYYNRACYKHFLGEEVWPKREVLNDLKESININPTSREFAQHDPDLTDLISDPDFKNL